MEPPRCALLARAARRDDAEADVVARRNVRHGGADRFDDAGALVAHHHGPASVAQLTVRQAHVRVAYAGSGDAYEHLVLAWRRDLDLLDDERTTGLVQDCSADPHQPIR